MKLYICANGFTQEQLDQARQAIGVFEEKHHVCSMSEELSQKLYQDESHCLFDAKESDLIISLGGDGALLRASKTAVKAERPLIGINSGRLGYLCAMSYAEIDRFDEILKECVISERKLLGIQGEDLCALNDITVSKDQFGKTVDLLIEAEDEEITIRGDGVIVCTPTGSTAYNLSAGGPRLDPKAEVIGITPICTHDRNTYPRVIKDDRKVRIKVNHESARIYADGEYLRDLKDQVEICTSDRTLKLCLRK